MTDYCQLCYVDLEKSKNYVTIRPGSMVTVCDDHVEVILRAISGGPCEWCRKPGAKHASSVVFMHLGVTVYKMVCGKACEDAIIAALMPDPDSTLCPCGKRLRLNGAVTIGETTYCSAECAEAYGRD